MNDKHLPENDRREYREWVAEMSAYYKRHQRSGRDMGSYLQADLARRDTVWAAALLRDAQIDGLWNALKNELKSESVTLVAHNGSLVGKATRVGAKKRKDDGSEAWAQALIEDMTWEQLEAWLARVMAQISALLVNRSMARRLLDLREQFPETVGPAEACSLLGTSIEDYLAADAV